MPLKYLGRAFQHLSVPEGNVLNYFYVFEFLEGYPVLYVRNMNAEELPFHTNQEFQEYNCEANYPCILPLEEDGDTENNFIDMNHENSFLNRLLLDGTVESYVEFITLKIVGGQVYLLGQADTKNDNQIVLHFDRMVNPIWIGHHLLRIVLVPILRC